MTDDELHRALLMHDREYRVVLGFLRSAGFAIPAQGAMACRWVLDEAKLGNARARFAAAKLLSVGLWIKQDKNQAREWCEKAADQQLPEAITMLAGFYESGWGGLEASRTTAIELWQRAIDLGETDAMCAMATLHFHDQSSSEDRLAAFSLLRRAAKSGNEVAQYILGSALVKESDPALEAEGLRWIQVAASNHSASAHRTLGYFYRAGEHGLDVDVSAARVHFEEADRLEEVPGY